MKNYGGIGEFSKYDEDFNHKDYLTSDDDDNNQVSRFEDKTEINPNTSEDESISSDIKLANKINQNLEAITLDIEEIKPTSIQSARTILVESSSI